MRTISFKDKMELWRANPWWLYVKLVARAVFTAADTSTIRLILAWASLLYALVLVISMFVGQPTFSRPFFSIMAWFGNEWMWSTAFFLHFVGVHWRIFDINSRPNWALTINGFGFIIWFVSTLSTNLAAQTLTPSTMLEWTMCAASAWALFRTGLKREVVTL